MGAPEQAGSRVAVFAPHPLMTVVISREESAGHVDRVAVQAGGQGIWVARSAATIGAIPVICALLGGETGATLEPLIAQIPGERRIVRTGAESGAYVTDARVAEQPVLAWAPSGPPTEPELDELFSLTCAAAVSCGTLVVTNPFPADALPLRMYGELVADARAGGARTLVDLSTPRLDSALEGAPDIVKINDWELAEFICGPVARDEELIGAAQLLRERGAQTVIITRAEAPALVLGEDGARWLTSPPFGRGHREGCGDAMMGALAGAFARGEDMDRALCWGAAAGAANYLRHGIGGASLTVIAELMRSVALTPAQ
jgi:1-phosphofructokinase